MDYVILIISAMLINNILLAQYLGNCPFLGVSKQMDTALGMGGAVIFVITLASLITWCINQWFLIPFKLEYLRTLVFILVIASLVQFIEIFMKKTMETLYSTVSRD